MGTTTASDLDGMMGAPGAPGDVVPTVVPRLGEVRRAVGVLRAFSEGIEPGCLDASTAAGMVELFGEASKVCAAVTTLLAGRVAQTKVWARSGARTPAEWVSRATGAPMGQAIGILETAERLDALPATERALRAGELSAAQVRSITEAAALDPKVEAELLAAAPRSSVRGLDLLARAAKAAADPAAAERRYQAAHRNRDLSTWIDPEGAGRLAWRGTPDALARLRHSLAPWVKAQLRAARSEGRDEPYGACAADALVALAVGAADRSVTRPAGRAHELLVRADLHELARPHCEPHALASIEGGGPIPDSVLDAILESHPIVKVAVTRGREISTIAHLGRKADAYLRSALAFRDPVCAVEGCDCGTGLEDHHIVAVADGGVTSLANTVRLCGHHHDLISYHRYRLVGSHRTGWRLVAPDGEGGPDPPDP